MLGLLSIGAVGCGNASEPTATSTSGGVTTSTLSSQSSTVTAVWPTATGGVRYQTPEAAARGFATDYLHMGNPVVGRFQQGDSRSGEVPLRPSATGPVTTVVVRQLGSDGSWWVLGAGTAAISVTDPTWNTPISSPVTLTGTSMALEGPVLTQVREDDNSKPLGQDYVTGGAAAMGPFKGSLAFTRARAKYGAVVLLTTSAETGAVMEASVIRVRFG